MPEPAKTCAQPDEKPYFEMVQVSDFNRKKPQLVIDKA